MGAAVEALAARFPVVVCKDRRDGVTRDVLLVVEYAPGQYGKVQLHFRAVLALKSFLHRAYDITRLDASEHLGNFKTVFEYPMTNMERRTAADFWCLLAE